MALLMHAGHFFELVLGELGLEPLPLAQLAGMDHFAVESEGILDDRVKKGFALDVVAVVVSASAREN